MDSKSHVDGVAKIVNDALNETQTIVEDKNKPDKQDLNRLFWQEMINEYDNHLVALKITLQQQLDNFTCQQITMITNQMNEDNGVFLQFLQAKKEELSKKFSGEIPKAEMNMIHKTMEAYIKTSESLLDGVITSYSRCLVTH